MEKFFNNDKIFKKLEKFYTNFPNLEKISGQFLEKLIEVSSGKFKKL